MEPRRTNRAGRAFWMAGTLLALILATPLCVRAQSSGEVVLPGDEATTQTWRAVRMRLNNSVSPLRELVQRSQREAQLKAAIDALERDLDLFERHARSLAIEEFASVQEVRGRIDKLLEHLAFDYANGQGAQFPTTLRLLDESVARLEDLAMQSDIRIGRRGLGRYSPMPMDWAQPRYPEPLIRSKTAVMTGRELCEAIRRRVQTMKRSPRDQIEQDGGLAARELGELARALILRQGDVDPIARPGFRNAALQMEVIAENQVDFHRRGDWTNYRRQLIALDDVLERALMYLDASP